MVGTSYLKWTHTVPKSAKKFVSKLSAEDSVIAVVVVRANADLSDEKRQSLLTPGNVRLCVTRAGVVRTPWFANLVNKFSLFFATAVPHAPFAGHSLRVNEMARGARHERCRG